MKNSYPKKIAVIGGGISGLTAAIYGQRCGYDVTVFEKNPNVGGLCTSWVRDGHLIDGCIHWLTGTKPGCELYDNWKDIHAFKDEDIIHDDIFCSVEYKGKTVYFYNDLNKLYNELIEISPIDKKMIKKYIHLIKCYQNFYLAGYLPTQCMGLLDFIKVGGVLLPKLKDYAYGATHSVEQFANKFKSELLRYALPRVVLGNGNLYCATFAYGTNIAKNGGFPKGGSKHMIDNMEAYFKSLGGKIIYNTQIDEILFDKNVAKGVIVKQESQYFDYIVSSCNIYETFILCKNRFKDKVYSKIIEKDNQIQNVQSGFMAAFTVDTNKFKELNLSPTHDIEIPSLKIGDSTIQSMKIHHYLSDETFIKDGKTVINVLVFQKDNDYRYWKELRKQSKKEYDKKKYEIANKMIEYIEDKYPSLKNEIKCIDVVTPQTYHRYTLSFHGAYMPFSFTNEFGMILHKGTLNRTKNLYLAGQWMITPGGLPPSMMSGKQAIQRILKSDKKNYRISKQRIIKLL